VIPEWSSGFLLCGATQDGQVMAESFDKMWSTGEGNGKPLQYSCLESPMNSMKRKKGMTLKDELWTEVRSIVQETEIKTIPKKKKCK